MRLQVRLFAAARQLSDCEVFELECPEGTTVAALRSALADACPNLRPLLPHVRFAINAQYALEHAVLTGGDEIACIPPVSGG